MPPQAAANLGLEGGETESLAVTMEAQGLSYTDSQSIEDPDAFGTVVDAKGRLRWEFQLPTSSSHKTWRTYNIGSQGV